MKQRILSLLLVSALIFTLPGINKFSCVNVFADEEDNSEDDEKEKTYIDTIAIDSIDDFIKLSEESRTQGYSNGRVFSLNCDLDLAGYPNVTVAFMDGYFDGKNHKITGLKLNEEMSDYGLFRFVGANGQIKNLTVEANITAGEDQQYIGIIAGSNEGVISDCVALGSVDGQSQTGGIVGQNEEFATIANCTNEASVNGKYQTGGIAGYNSGIISNCKNAGYINGNAKVLKSNIDSDGSAVNISIPNAVIGLAADDRANETGGIAGYSEGRISGCKNSGVIGYEHLGSSTGGIVGHQYGKVQNCENTGTIYGHKRVGGIVGYFEPYEAFEYDVDYIDQLRTQLDELSDIIDSLADAGEALGDDFSNNTDVLSDEVKYLRKTLEDYEDGFAYDLDAARGSIRTQTNQIKSIVDDMDYDFKAAKLIGYADKIKDDIDKMLELISMLKLITADWSIQDAETLQEILNAISQYEELSSKYSDFYNKLLGIIEGAGKHKSNRDDDDDEAIGEPVDEPDDETEVPEETPEEQPETPSDEPEDNPTDGPSDEPETPSDEPEENPSDTPDESPSGEDLGGESACITIVRELPYYAAPNEVSILSENKLTPEQLAKIAYILEQLAEINADIKLQSDKIQGIVDDWPDELDDIEDDLKDIRERSGKAYGATNELIDKIDARADMMRADVRKQGDVISDTVDYTKDQLNSDWDRFNKNIDLLTDKAHDLRMTVSDGYDEIRNRIKDHNIYIDISESADIKGGTNGRVLSCVNSGEIYGDSIAGGIVGSIDKEDRSEASLDAVNNFIGTAIDSDKEDDDEDEEDDDESDAISKHVEAVVYDCKNLADINIDTDYAGGVVGKSAYGMLQGCSNFGDVAADDGKYIGGVAGYSKLCIKDSYVLGGLNGKSFVGGVAGKGNDIYDSYVCAYMDMGDDFSKSAGAIAGKTTGTVFGNYFVDNGYGAVDGVTKIGEADGITYKRMLSLGNLPNEFKSFTVRFIDEDDVIWSDTFKYGDEFAQEEYPELVKKDGEYVYWENKNVSPVCRNVTIHAIRRVFIPSIQAKVSENTGSKPDMLLGGEFYPDSELGISMLSADQIKEADALVKGIVNDIHYVIIKGYNYNITQEEAFSGDVTLRILLNGLVGGNRLLILDENFKPVSEIIEFEKVESFATIDTVIPANGYIIIIDKVSRVTVAASVIVIIIVLAILILGLIFFRRKRKKLQKKIKQALADIEKPLEELETANAEEETSQAEESTEEKALDDTE